MMSNLDNNITMNKRKLFLATGIGNIFEIFDFFVFVFLSPVIADLFFPKSVGWLSIMFTYFTITISYMLRPIGAMVLGNLGDKYGRKSIFSLSILMTAIPSLIIGLSPTYHQVGVLAVVILLVSRILQGFSSGAEMPGAVTFIAENYHQKNYYYYVSWIPFGANISIALGSWMIHEMIKSMSKEFLYGYGWRIPFLVGSLLAVLGFYIRKNIAESQEFKLALEKNKIASAPILMLFAQYKLELVMGIILVTLASLMTAVFHVFLPNLFVKFLHFNLLAATTASSIGALTIAISIVIFAILTNKIKPIIIVQVSIVGIIVVLGLLFCGKVSLSNLHNIYTVIILLSILVGGVNGVYWGILIDLFPVQVRYSGIASCFSIASLIGAGLAPLWTSSILASTGSYRGVILVCMIVAIIALINGIFLSHYIKMKTKADYLLDDIA